MLTVQPIDNQSPYLHAVMQLWRTHSDTLGYMPVGAFEDHARDRHVLVALNGTACVGYVLFRTGRERVTIAHFCVAPVARKQGVARAMLKCLTDSTNKKYRGIRLACRRDFEATKMWPRLGFHAVSESPGRTPGTIVVHWGLDYDQRDLFSGADETGALAVAIDFNVFLDLVEGRNVETEGLRADWLQPLLKLCYTPELLNEINRISDIAVRKQRQREAAEFEMLPRSATAFDKADSVLKPLFPDLKTPQEESDYRHLVGALAAEADAFVTRDDGILARADDIFKACGLSVVRPVEMIGQIDVIENEREYQRNFVAGTRQVVQERVQCADDSLLTAIQLQGEQQRKLAAMLNTLLADPHRARCHKVTGDDGTLLAAFVVERESGVDRVPLLRICAKRKAGTIARSVLTGLIRNAVSAGSRAVFVTESRLPEIVQAACTALGFLPVAGGRLKLVLSGWLKAADVPAAITWTDPKIEELNAALPSVQTDALRASQIEHLLWPAKIADAALPCFIVPIRPQFAEHLFDERLAAGDLFGADVDLALNPESAYYRAARPEVITSPARVLWYVSERGTFAGTMSIRACSRVVELSIDVPKRLYTRFKRLGVYEWSHVRKTAKDDLNKKIMAFQFDDTELLRPVPWATFQAILKANGINHNLFSPVKIPASVFGEIYLASFNSSEVR